MAIDFASTDAHYKEDTLILGSNYQFKREKTHDGVPRAPEDFKSKRPNTLGSEEREQRGAA